MKVEVKDKEQSVTTEKNYDYTTWNVGDIVYYSTNPDVHLGTGYIFHGHVDHYIILKNQNSRTVSSVNTDITKGGYTLVESKQKPKQDVVLTLEHDWEVALVTSLLGAVSKDITDKILRQNVLQKEFNIYEDQWNLLADYCDKVIDIKNIKVVSY